MSEDGVRLTVSEQPKVEKLKKTVKAPSKLVPILKCFVAGFISLAVLGCGVCSKIFVITIAEHLNGDFKGNSTSSENTPRREENARLFIMVCLIMMVPQAFSFLRAAWASLRLKGRPWPTKKAILAGVIGSVLEVIGLCVFTIVTLSKDVQIRGNESVAVMNCISIAPILRQLFKKRSSLQSSLPRKALFVFCGLIQLAAFVAVIVFADFKPLSISILSLLLVSIAWTPKLRKWQIKPRSVPGQEEEDMDMDGDDFDQPIHPGQFLHRKTARTKATVISEALKLLLTPFVAFLVAWMYNLFEPGDIHSGFEQLGTKHDALFKYFLANIFLSLAGYMLAVLACSMAMQKIAFALPLTLMTPLSFTFLSIHTFSSKLGVDCESNEDIKVIPLVIFVWVTQMMSTIYYVWKSQDVIMAKEDQLFWVPSYNGVLLEQNLLLNRKNQLTEEYFVNHNKLAKDSCVFICTTMYHEADFEMEQLLSSLHRVDCARDISKRRIEAHIWFDGAVKRDVLNNYVLQLISLVANTMQVDVGNCMKLETPYGMELRWRLPGGMNFHIHLKDNIKVKNKKRWSQVMYMSYVLDFKIKELEVREEDTYILTTDADIMFDPESVEALLDIMMRDPKVGAVCGRTHPLGNGPLVWYQTFDYAIGHWFQKVANHVLGSVLCCPGCFSVYRANALRDVLPLYATTADHAVDFLTKDMGEDRWLCTLMVQAGWRLEYCAAAENSTYCPDNFDEFYKQRRRWIPSTLANLALLISEWNVTTDNNDSVSFLFILYQALNVVSTLIGPATVILIIVGGLQYGWSIDSLTTLILLILVSLFYGAVCLFTSQAFQLKTAKVLTFLFALLMGAVFVGLIEQIAENPGKTEATPTTLRPTAPTPAPITKPTTKPTTNALYYPDVLNPTDFSQINFDSDYFVGNASKSTTARPKSRKDEPLLGFDVSSWYFFALLGIFVVTALCHLTEAYCLCHGVWYLLCLPSGYLFLTIYSVCNLTDRSWGTRENKVKSDDGASLLEVIKDKLIWLCRGCKDPEPNREPEVQPINGENEQYSDTESDTQVPEEPNENLPQESGDQIVAAPPISPTRTTVIPKSALKKPRPQSPGGYVDGNRKTGFRFPGDKGVRFQGKLPKAKTHIPVSEWLAKRMKVYIPNFERNGYDDSSFIADMTEKDLQYIGIETRGHRRNIMNEIEQLPNWELDNDVPDDVETWLSDLGLHEYWLSFQSNGYTTPRDLEGLKMMNKSDLESTLHDDINVLKRGHFNKLVKAIKKLQYPSAIERKIRAARSQMNKVKLGYLLGDGEGKEFQFWVQLREEVLLPESKAFGQHSELSDKLEELRDSALVCMAVSNLMWIILMSTLASKADLQVVDVNPLGLSFLVVFGLILVIQFLTMFWHRLSTICHLLARAPFKVGDSSFKNWSFSDFHLQPPPTEDDLRRVRQKRKSLKGKRHHSREMLLSQSHEEERPLLNGQPTTSYSPAIRPSPTLPV